MSNEKVGSSDQRRGNPVQLRGTIKLMCGLDPRHQINLEAFEGRVVHDRDGNVVGHATNVRVEGNCVVADVRPLIGGGK